MGTGTPRAERPGTPAPIPAAATRKGRRRRCALGVHPLVAYAFLAPFLIVQVQSRGCPPAPHLAAARSLDGTGWADLRWDVAAADAALVQQQLGRRVGAHAAGACPAAAYALTRLDLYGKRLLFAVVPTLFIPGIIFLSPSHLIADVLGWLDGLWAVIGPGAAEALGVFSLRQVLLSLPRVLEAAALVDGANRFQICPRLTLPLDKPALATPAVPCFPGNNCTGFLWPIYVPFNPDNLTLPPGLATLRGRRTTD